MSLPIFHAKASHLRQHHAVKVVLRYMPAPGREPIHFGTLHLPATLWATLSEAAIRALPLLGSKLVVDERGWPSA